jgi:hypothetical protein
MTDINQKLYLKVFVANMYMRKHKITPKQLLKLNEKCGLFEYLEAAYESLHLTGAKGILEEVEAYCENNRK